jgi:hypothetical protein
MSPFVKLFAAIACPRSQSNITRQIIGLQNVQLGRGVRLVVLAQSLRPLLCCCRVVLGLSSVRGERLHSHYSLSAAEITSLVATMRTRLTKHKKQGPAW